MRCLVPAVRPYINSGTVGAAVAALLTASLVGHREDSNAIFKDAVAGMQNAFDAAFSGHE
jgi:hypothetical protein